MRIALAIALIAAASRAQATGDAEWQRPRPLSLDEAGATAVMAQGGARDKIAALDFRIGDGVERLPFASPVREVAVGRLLDGTFVVLAGGIKDELDVYRFDPATRSLERHPTDGGRRLRTTFGGGLGSWPRCGTAGLMLFAFERDEKVQFRAVASRRALASRVLPIDCDGFRVELDARTREVRVAFLGADGRELDGVAFPHPVAPRLAVVGADGGRVDFGGVPLGGLAERRVVLRNEGEYLLEATLSVDGPFELAGGAREVALRLAVTAPGDAAEVVVVCRPVVAGPVAGRLRVASPVPTAQAVVDLRAVAIAVDVVPGRAASPAPREVDAPVSPAPAASAARLREPERVGFDARWVDQGRLRVSIRLSAADAAAPRIALRNRRLGEAIEARVAAEGLVDATFAAQVFDPIEIAAIGSGGPGEWTELGRAPPALRLHGRWVSAHVPPGAEFLLLEVLQGDGDAPPRRVLRSWRGRADASGSARFDVASLVGEGEAAAHLAVLVRSPDGRAIVSRVVEIGPSSPDSRGDRAK